jgi:hypothetical protein
MLFRQPGNDACVAGEKKSVLLAADRQYLSYSCMPGWE